MQMKYVDGNENVQKQAKHEQSSVLIRVRGRKTNEKVFYKIWAREEAGFNIVMSNLKFKHNKSGFRNFSKIRKRKLLLIKRFFLSAVEKIMISCFALFNSAQRL